MSKKEDTKGKLQAEHNEEEMLPPRLYFAQLIKKNMFMLGVGLALIFTILLVYKYTSKTGPIEINGTQFSSSIGVGDKMSVSNKADLNGIFTYGPYLDLQKGSYTVTVNYSADTDIDFQVSSGYGVTNHKTVTLPTDKTQYSFPIELSSSINNKSLEFRTFYHGKGSFTLDKVTVTSGSSSGSFAVLLIIMYALSAALCLFAFRKTPVRGTALTAYLGVSALLMHPALSTNAVGPMFFAVMAIILMLTVYYTKSITKLTPAEFACEVVIAFVSAYFIAAGIAANGATEKISTINFMRCVDKNAFPTIMLSALNILLVLRFITQKPLLLRIIAEGSVFYLAITFLRHADRNIYFTAGVVAVSALFTYILFKDTDLNKIKLDKNVGLFFVAVGFVVFSIFYSVQTCARYRSFGASAFDFGIFAQMYEGILRTGLPVTTLERNELLSHFYIHFSPIYYVLVPIYAIVRSPETLLVCQAVLVGLGVFPVYFLCCHKSKNYLTAVIISFAYLFMPSCIGPLFYDFHENAFLPVMLLSTLYFLEVKKYRPMFIFAALTLLIKEDAAIYVLSIALYAIFSKKEYKIGAAMFGMAAVYFALVMTVIAHFGKGLMDSHYGMYYLPGEKGVAVMFKNMLYAPGLVISTCFNNETFEFILYTAGALLFMPFIGKKTSRLWLIVPYLLINLVTSYSYQHNIGYQYVFGTCALLLFIAVLNMYDSPAENHGMLSIVMLLACICAAYTFKGDFCSSYKGYKANERKYIENDELLQSIPKDVSITAETFLAPHLYNYKEVYLYKYDKEYTDYYVLQRHVEDYEKFTADLEKRDYKKAADNGRVIIYKAKNAPDLK